MKRMKSKKLNSALIAASLSAALLLGGAGVLTVNNGVKTVHAETATAIVNKTPESKANIYYVGLPEGQDESQLVGEGTQSNPFSLGKFNKDFLDREEPTRKLEGGDIVRFTPGEHYFEPTVRIYEDNKGRTVYSSTGNMRISWDGKFDDYIIFEAADPTQKTTLNFKKMSFDSTNRGVEINGDYIYWHNVDVCGAGDNGMYIAGSYNVVENCEFYNNRDTGLQLGRAYSEDTSIQDWPSYNLIKNCTSYNNYDNETYGENADGFAAKLTVGYGNMFDGCIAYRNSDDGWDLYAKVTSGNIGAVIIYNCLAFENGLLMDTMQNCNDWFKYERNGQVVSSYNTLYDESNTNAYITRDGDGNGFKLGGGAMEGDVILNNCMSFHNRMHGVTDNSNPGVLSIFNVTSYNNGVTTKADGSIDVTTMLTEKESKYANIDTERTVESYNNYRNILSTNNGSVRMGADAYKGSAEYSILTASGDGKKSYKLEENKDFDSQGAEKGTRIDSPKAADLYEALPAEDLGIKKLDNRSDGLYYIHKTLRNAADNSINVGNILKIKSQPIAGKTIGCDLTKTSFEEYPNHYPYTYLTSLTEDQNGDGVVDNYDAVMMAVKEMLYIQADPENIYQDFQLVVRMNACLIEWSSSDESVIKIGTEHHISGSFSEEVDAIVYRQDTEKKVTLTATITGADGKKGTKSFEVNVKKITYKIGDVMVDGVVDGKTIIDQFSIYELPDVNVGNATDYHGKLIDPELYDVTTKYMYAESKGKHQNEVHHFTASNAGVYQIIHTVKLGTVSKDYSYNLFVVSGNAQIDFAKDEENKPKVLVGVDYNGYYIKGELNNVSGTLYAMVAEEEPTPLDIMRNGTSYKITDDNIFVNFKQNNDKPYTVYYVVCNPNGAATSPVYSAQITQQEIATKEDFNALMAEGGSASVIYSLAADLDYTGDSTYKTSTAEFIGYLDGKGHTIKGIETSGDTSVGVIGTLYGGTICNLTFENIKVKGTGNEVGVIAKAYSGTIVNVHLRNVKATTDTERCGGLIGHVYESCGGALVIDRVSVINTDNENYYISSKRSGGIIGFMQTNSSAASIKSNFVDVKISNCYVDAVVGDQKMEGSGGIVGTWSDDGYLNIIKSYSLEITDCVFAGTCKASNRAGGMLAYQKGAQRVRITNCINVGTMYHTANAEDPVIVAEKNCSGMMGGYNATADCVVTNCYARFEEHNSSADVTVIGDEILKENIIWENLGLDYVDVWELVVEDGVHVAPYVKLR